MLLDAAEGVIVKEVVKKQIELNKAANLLFPLSHKIHTIDESFRGYTDLVEGSKCRDSG